METTKENKENKKEEEIHDTVNWKILAGLVIFAGLVSLGCAFIEPFKDFVLNILANIFVFLARLAYPM